jgi:energy-coupling factor transporter ATP-binding protein EcfA2
MKLRGVAFAYPGRGGFALGPLVVEGPRDRPWLILGPSGSGKSTLLRLLGGVLTPREGTIEGTGPGSAAYLPQFPERALAGRNLAEDLTGNLRPSTETRRRLREILERVGLRGLPLSRRSRTLSEGERRRLALGLLCLSGHDHWALDEPDAALDRTGQETLVRLLAGRDASREAVWIGTHRFSIYGPLRPWVVVLNLGQLVACGELGDVLGTPAAGEVLSLARRPEFALQAGLDGGRNRPRVSPSGVPPGRDRETLVRLQLQERMGL